MEEGLSYEAALAKAQELGYAEAVPDADVLGWDALAKVTILANVVFGAALKPTDSPCEGITKITAADIAKAKADGKRYKLIGRVWREGGAVKAAVAPRLVDLCAAARRGHGRDQRGGDQDGRPRRGDDRRAGCGEGPDRVLDACRPAADRAEAVMKMLVGRPVGGPRQEDRGARPVRQLR